MRIDVISIFPQYLAALELSLIGKAQAAGLLDIRVHDLREFTDDARRTVDDTPYGGGAGMVMTPQPWGLALDQASAAAQGDQLPVLLVPSPAGEVFNQKLAANLATQAHIVFACGRYEGIDERVLVDAQQRFRVVPVSLGDYVLNGGEVAALVMIEAITRLIPGVIGNPDSLVEESHEDGLLEYPVYTKPAQWRGLAVPEVLLSGDHGRIASWRREQQQERTAARRPDLLPPVDVQGIEVRLAVAADAGQLTTMTSGSGLTVPTEFDQVVVALRGTRIIGWLAFHGTPPHQEVAIEQILVVADEQGKGVAATLLAEASRRARAAGQQVVAAIPQERRDMKKWAKRHRLQRLGPPDDLGVARYSMPE